MILCMVCCSKKLSCLAPPALVVFYLHCADRRVALWFLSPIRLLLLLSVIAGSSVYVVLGICLLYALSAVRITSLSVVAARGSLSANTQSPSWDVVVTRTPRS